MNPDFGTIIWSMIFENLTTDTKALIQADVTRIISTDPRIRVENILVTEYQQGLQIELDLATVSGDLSETLRFNFDRSTRSVNLI